MPTLLKTGSGVVDHSNVMQALDREGASALAKENATTAREVLIKGGISPDAIRIID